MALFTTNMVHYVTGNLLDSPARALVNTVNTVGVMGKGIALQFKEAYPHNFVVYKQACKSGELVIGKILPVQDRDAFGERLIINFPTKKHWRNPSEYAYVESGLKALRCFLESERLPDIALPPLGCGNGGLDWERVNALMVQYLGDLDTKVYIYPPNERIRQQLRKQTPTKGLQLTPARAMLLHSLFHYETEGDLISLFVANKLAFFLQLLGQPMRLTFKKHFYGPYAPQMNAFARIFNGSYLRGLEQGNAKPFEHLPLNYDIYPQLEEYVSNQLNPAQQMILQRMQRLLKGYKSAYPLEVLATVAWIHHENPAFGVAEIIDEARKWSARKEYLLQPEHVTMALQRIKEMKTVE